MPVLDGSIVQVQLGQRRSVRLRVILPDSPHVLPGRLGADAQAPGQRLDRHPGRVPPQRARLLGRHRRAVRHGQWQFQWGMLYLTDLARVIAAWRGWSVIAHKGAGRGRGLYRRPDVVTHLKVRCAPGPGPG